MLTATDKSIVSGYIREHESTHDFINIPPLISHKCLQYYADNEYFSKVTSLFTSEDYFEISKDRKTVTNVGGYSCWIDHVIFCNKRIKTLSNVITKWTFFIDNIGRGAMFFGLQSSECIRLHNLGTSCYIDIDLKSNDTLTFILDLTNDKYGEFYVKKNDDIEKMINDHIEKDKDIEYTMILRMQNKNDCVVLKNFEECFK